MSIRRELHLSLFVQMDQIRREFYSEVILLLLLQKWIFCLFLTEIVFSQSYETSKLQMILITNDSTLHCD